MKLLIAGLIVAVACSTQALSLAQQTPSISASDLASLRSALLNRALVQRSFPADVSVAYEYLEGRLRAIPVDRQAFLAITVSDVQQKGPFLLLRGTAVLYVRVEGSRQIARVRSETPAALTVYLPSVPVDKSLQQVVSDELFFPNVETALASIPEAQKACLPQLYSPAAKKLVAGPSCTTPPTDEGVQPPKLLKQVDPTLPPQLANTPGVWANTVSLTINEKGIPEAVHVVRPAFLTIPAAKGISDLSTSALDDNAVTAVKKYRFSPATKGGTPVPTHLFIDVQYQSFGH